MTRERDDKNFWNAAALQGAAWYSATKFNRESDDFFATGAADVDVSQRLTGMKPPKGGTLVELGCGAGRMTRALSERSGTVIATDISAGMLERARVNLDGRSNVEFIELDGDGSLPFDTDSVDAVYSYITMQHVSTAKAQERYLVESLRVVRPGGWVVLHLRRTGLRAVALDTRANVANFLCGHNTLRQAWRGARLPESTVRSYRTDDVSIDILRSDPRHVWVVARRQVAPMEFGMDQ